MENEKNLGLFILNKNAAELKTKTVIVVGLGRSGTSMLSGILTKLGVYMGETSPPLYEDSSLSKAIDKLDKAEIKKIIHQRNQKYPIWGIKKPSLKKLSLRHLFREPVYIVIFRDIFAIANRRAISKNQDLLKEMFKSYYAYLHLLLFLRFTKKPVLIVSYEKSLLFPENLVIGISDFLGLNKTSAELNEIAQFIQSSPEAYTNHQRFLGEVWDGYIEKVNSQEVIGWVASKIDSNQPITLELLVNDIYQQSTTTTIKRADVTARHPQISETCGFSFKLPPQKYLTEEDKVEVRIANENIFLKKRA